MRRMLLLVAALGATIAGGCATALNMQDETLRKPYGGFTLPPDEFFGGDHAGEMGALMFWPMWLLDKPLSLAADTLTLPYTLWVQHNAQLPAKGQSAESNQSPQPIPPSGREPVLLANLPHFPSATP